MLFPCDWEMRLVRNEKGVKSCGGSTGRLVGSLGSGPAMICSVICARQTHAETVRQHRLGLHSTGMAHGGVGGAAGQRSDMIEGLREVQHTVAGHTAPCGLEPDGAARRGGEADRAALRRKHCVRRRLFVATARHNRRRLFVVTETNAQGRTVSEPRVE